MKQTFKLPWGLLAIFVGVGVVYIIVQMNRPKERVIWYTDYMSAKKEAIATGKPLFVDFTATWCGPCQQMKTTTWADKTVADALDKYVRVEVDIDQNPGIAQEYQIQAVPTYFVVDAKSGDILKANDGLISPAEFLDWLGQPSRPATSQEAATTPNLPLN
jgi:thiol:disulfide interchange protein